MHCAIPAYPILIKDYLYIQHSQKKQLAPTGRQAPIFSKSFFLDQRLDRKFPRHYSSSFVEEFSPQALHRHDDAA